TRPGRPDNGNVVASARKNGNPNLPITRIHIRHPMINTSAQDAKRNASLPLSAVSDEELLERYRQNRDRRAFEEIVKRYQGELFSYLRRYLGDSALAEDAFQATFLQLHLKCNSFERGRRLRPWLYTIATNQAIDAQRRNKRHRAASLNGGRDEQKSLLELSEGD